MPIKNFSFFRCVIPKKDRYLPLEKAYGKTLIALFSL